MTTNERIARELMGWQDLYERYSPLGGKNFLDRGNFDCSLEACFKMEERIEKKGLSHRYMNHFMSVMRESDPEFEAFDSIHATAAQRAEACILMLDEINDKK